MDNNNYIKTDEEAFKEECKDYSYQPPIIGPKKRVIAIGDIHGDLDLAIECFKIAHLINDELEWTGEDTFDDYS